MEEIRDYDTCVTLEESAELARMALAATDSEPVAYADPQSFDNFKSNGGKNAACTKEWMWRDSSDGLIPLYRHAQQPVVPEVTAGDCPAFIKYDVTDVDEAWARGFNDCRAAMLQAGNAPAIPDGYVMVPVEPTEEMNKAGWAAMNEHDAINPTYRAMLAAAPHETPAPNSVQSVVTVSDTWIPVSERMPEAGGDMIVFTDGIVMSGISYAKKKGFYIQALEYDDDESVDSVTHWMPLPAAPQEVKK